MSALNDIGNEILGGDRTGENEGENFIAEWPNCNPDSVLQELVPCCYMSSTATHSVVMKKKQNEN